MPHKSLPHVILDPFGERVTPRFSASWTVLGAHCRVDSNDARLMRLAEAAYAGLPPHRLGRRTPDLHLRLLAVRNRQASHSTRPAFALVSGAGLLAAADAQAGFMALCVERRAALITVGSAQLRHPHDVRYELIECAFYTLAARTQGLLPLHAACISKDGRGVLIMGSSGVGKSTLAWHALTAGLELIAEDSVFVTPRTLTATGVANFLHLRIDSPHAAAAGRAASVIERRSGVRKYEIDLRKTGFKLAPRPVSVIGSVFLSARPVQRGKLLSPLSAAQAGRRLRTEQPYAASQQHWSEFTKRLLQQPCVELRRAADPAVSAAAIAALLSEA